MKRKYFYISLEHWAWGWFSGFGIGFVLVFWFALKLRSESHKKRKSSKSRRLLRTICTFIYSISLCSIQCMLKLRSIKWFKNLKQKLSLIYCISSFVLMKNYRKYQDCSKSLRYSSFLFLLILYQFNY